MIRFPPWLKDDEFGEKELWCWVMKEIEEPFFIVESGETTYSSSAQVSVQLPAANLGRRAPGLGPAQVYSLASQDRSHDAGTATTMHDRDNP